MSSWLITGGTGSFGKAYTRRLLDRGARRVVVLSRDELKQAEMRREIDDPRMRYFIGSVTDLERCEMAMQGVDYVVHAAAMKRIEVCEQNPAEAVETNIHGTKVIAHACVKAGVKRAVFLSTDKAVAPNTHYGATKLAAERLWTQANVYAANSATRLSATRYGNVLGSRGSVVPLFRAQAAAGGPLTVTDKRMTRFFMRMDDALDLVDLAFKEMRGGEVFIPKIPSADIPTVAASVSDTAPVEEVGIRRGEKLHETLIGEDEARHCHDHGDHYRIEPDRTWELPALRFLTGTLVPDGFEYRSDTNADRLTAERLRGMCA